MVVIETNLGYQNGAAAGTGIVLSHGGEILTNNRVIRGATTIRVVDHEAAADEEARDRITFADMDGYVVDRTARVRLGSGPPQSPRNERSTRRARYGLIRSWSS